MLTYKASFKFLDDGIHAEVLDFPGVLTCGRDLDEARTLLAGALVDMAETSLMLGEKLPVPDPSLIGDGSDLDEPIHLILNASSTYTVVPTIFHEAA